MSSTLAPKRAKTKPNYFLCLLLCSAHGRASRCVCWLTVLPQSPRTHNTYTNFSSVPHGILGLWFCLSLLYKSRGKVLFSFLFSFLLHTEKVFNAYSLEGQMNKQPHLFFKALQFLPFWILFLQWIRVNPTAFSGFYAYTEWRSFLYVWSTQEGKDKN